MLHRQGLRFRINDKSLPGKPDLSQNYEKLDHETLSKIIETHGASMSLEDKARLSLAGAQDKITVHLIDDEIYLPIKQTPSTYILKFEVSHYKNVPLYEVYTTWLAKAIGLNTVDIQLRFLNDSSYTLSRRYDRKTGDRTLRIHQEDFCQALGLKEKYQHTNTPNFALCYQLIIEHSTNPLIDSEQLLKWQIFILIAGNSDAHIKNISFLYQDNETRLAPFYDLVCTRAIKHLDENLALHIGNQKNPNLISKDNLIELAKQCQVRPKRILNTVDQMVIDIDENKDRVKAELEMQYGEQPALQRIERVIKQQTNLLRTIQSK